MSIDEYDFAWQAVDALEEYVGKINSILNGWKDISDVEKDITSDDLEWVLDMVRYHIELGTATKHYDRIAKAITALDQYADTIEELMGFRPDDFILLEDLV